METTESDRQTSVSIMRAAAARAAGRSFGKNQWGKRHAECWNGAAFGAGHDRAKLPEALALMIRGWVCYADAYRAAYEGGIEGDRVLGREWEQIGRALLDLLIGDLGPLDGGTLDGLLRSVLKNEGVEV